MITLSENVSKCLSCNWVGDSWDRFCKVDPSHPTAEAWAWLNKPAEDSTSWFYTYSSDLSDPSATLKLLTKGLK
jgi:hypothetical protein